MDCNVLKSSDNSRLLLHRLLSTNSWPSRLGLYLSAKGSRYDTEESDGEASVMLELWGMRRVPSLPSLPGPLWPRVVAPDRVLCMGQIEPFDIKQCT